MSCLSLGEKVCILFCNQLCFNLFGTLSPRRSVHRWIIAAALHPAKCGVSQLRGHYLDRLRSPVGQRADMYAARQIGRSASPIGRACSRLMLQISGDCRWKISNMQRGRFLLFGGANRNETICFESGRYLCFRRKWENRLRRGAPFKTPARQKGKQPMKTKHGQIKSFQLRTL